MRYAVVVASLLVGLCVCSPASGHGRTEPPKRVLIVVLDQFRPDLVDTFDMRNVKALMRDGVSFDNAYLGHMASETVISHNVITSGQLPRDMGWADEAFRDSDDVLGAGKDSMWVSGSLTRDQFNALIAHGGYCKLADYLHAAHPGTKFITAGQKNYAVYSANGPTGDISVTFSSRNFDCDGGGATTGAGRPASTSRRTSRRPRAAATTSTRGPRCRTARRRRRRRGCTRSTATASRPGFDPAHLGGDVWTADAGMAMMEKRALERHAAHARLDRQGEPHVGRHHRHRHLPAGLGRGAGAPALHRQDGGRPGRPDHAQAARPRPCSTTRLSF